MPDQRNTTESVARRNRNLRFLFLSLAVLSGVFSGMVIGALLMIQLDVRNVHPPETRELVELRKELAQDPENRQNQERFRRLDRDNRRYVLARRTRMTTGALMLAGGLIVLVVCAQLYARLDPKIPAIRHAGADHEEESWLTPRRRNVLAVMGVTAVLLSAILLSAHLGGVKLTETVVFKENWPGFRGPDGLGIAPDGNWPITWDVKAGANILWQTKIPLPGKSSPIIWGDRVFVTGATPEAQELFCFDRKSGKPLWQISVQSEQSLRWKQGGEDERVMESDFTGSAAPTPTTDGKRVYVCFNTNDVAAVDFAGKVKWVKNLGKPESAYGLASSLRLVTNTLIYQCDQGYNADEELSAIYGLDTATGEIIWRTDRPVSNSWSSPILARTRDRVEIVVAAEPWVIAYEPEYGDELWRANVLGGGEIGSSPAYADGVVYVTDDEVELVAIQTGGADDVTKTHVLWRLVEGMPDTSSPVCDGRYLVQADSGGRITCIEPKTGKLLWKKDLRSEFWSSPIVAGKLLYLMDNDGKGLVIELGKTYSEVGRGNLGERIDSTPAFADSVIYIRTEKHLFAIGNR